MPGTGLVAGVDPSSSKFVVAVGDRRAKNVQFRVLQAPTGPENRPRALADIHKFGTSIIQEFPALVRVGVESPVVAASGPGSTIPQALGSGAFQAAISVLPRLAVDMVTIPSWKKTIVGKGNAAKDEIYFWVQQNFPSIWEQHMNNNQKHVQDMCDAFCIYLYTLKRQAAFDKVTRLRSVK